MDDVRPPSPPKLEIVGVDGRPPLLDELVAKPALADLATSAQRMFQVPVGVVSATRTVLASAGDPGPVQALLSRWAASAHRSDAIAAEWDSRTSTGICATGNGTWVAVTEIVYNQRRIGWVSAGPYVLPDAREPPPELLLRAKATSVTELRDAWVQEPRAEHARMAEIGDYLSGVIELMLFHGHKALVASQMHLAGIHESYRELCEKNQRLEEAYDRLKELDRLKSNFLATISHELRTPLTSIMGYGEMLSEGVAGPLNDDQRDFVGTIRSKSEQLLALIVSLLDYSKLENGKTNIRLDHLDVATLIEEAVSMLVPSALKKRISLSREVQPNLCPLFGDAGLLRQVFVNLMENSMKFTPPGGSIRVEAHYAAEGASPPGGVELGLPPPIIEVRVVDTGIGIPEAERERVFDAFYQVDQSSTRKYGGTGLGLAIVRRLVQAHQGTVHVESNLPQGTVLVVSLPTTRADSDELPAPSQEHLPAVFE